MYMCVFLENFGFFLREVLSSVGFLGFIDNEKFIGFYTCWGCEKRGSFVRGE